MRVCGWTTHRPPTIASGCRSAPIPRRSATPIRATRRWASRRTSRSRAGSTSWNPNDHVTYGIQAGFLYSFLDDGPMGYFSKPDFTGCNAAGLSDVNCTYDPTRPRHINATDNTT
jgi:hypothetical protein